MTKEEIQLLVTAFNKNFNEQFNELRKDLHSAIEKISDKIVLLGEENISCSKDIESIREWNKEKIKEMGKDIDGIGETFRAAKKDITKTVEEKMKTTEEKIKNGDLMTRLLVGGSFISGMSGLVLFLIKYF